MKMFEVYFQYEDGSKVVVGRFLDEQVALRNVEVLTSDRGLRTLRSIGAVGGGMDIKDGPLSYIEAEVLHGEPPFREITSVHANAETQAVTVHFATASTYLAFHECLLKYIRQRQAPGS